jgi:hypothetical protein
MRCCQRQVASLLVAVLLVLSGAAGARVAAHAIQHHHHQADTHRTTICAWLCIAGQSADAAPTLVEPAVWQATVAPQVPPPQSDTLIHPVLVPRGPPRPLLA